jgi:metal-responsive CopG/Arc/MetJ family transcriptional regulator
MADARTKPVSVRLPSEVVELLDERSREKGTERSEFLRDLIVTGLDRPHSDDDVRERLTGIEDKLRDVRQDLATLTKALLVMVARVDDDAADEWVRENFRSTSGGGD